VHLEVRIYGGIGERTGISLPPRSLIRGRRVCGSLPLLRARYAQFGDGIYYLAQMAWPAGATSVDLRGPIRGSRDPVGTQTPLAIDV